MQFEIVTLIQISHSPTPVEIKLKGSNGHCSYTFSKLQKLFEQYIDSAVYRQMGYLSFGLNVDLQ